MSCKVEYHNGKIDKVYNLQGGVSKLYKEIASLPFVDNLEKALETYKNTFSKNVNKNIEKQAKQEEIANLYVDRINYLKSSDPEQFWSVDVPSMEDVKLAIAEDRMVDVNGGMGIVTRDGNMIGMFKYDEKSKGTAQAVQSARVAKGGIKLDNFDGYLTKLYEKNGFRVVARVPFNEEYAPEGWNKDKHGTPDVVSMIYDPQNKLNIEEKIFDDYDEAMAYRDSFVEEAKALKSGKQNTDFFEGKAKEASSNIPYSPVLNVDQSTPVAKAYNLYTAGGNFTGHISKMIAGFQEKQKQVAEAIVKGDFNSFLDIGTSEGGMIKTVASQDKNIVAVGVDPNREMQKNFSSTPSVDNAEYRLEAFQGSWIEDDGTEIKEFKSDRKFDVINEDFTFQFVNNNRAKQVAGVKELMNKDGIFITSEKFHTDNEANNEAKKYDHQRKYFSPDQLTEDKQTIVSGMADDMVNDVEYFNILKNNFKFVEEFWNAGNFKGYLASDSNKVLQEFKKNVGDLTSEFTDSKSLTKNTTEPNLEFVVNNESFGTYKEALLNSEGADISIGITTEGFYKELYNVSSNTNLDTLNGFVNSYIKSNVISDKKFIENGESFFVAEGGTDYVQVVNEYLIDEDAKFYLGTANRKVTKDGRITLTDGKGEVDIEVKNGKNETVKIADLDSMSNEEIQIKFEDSDMVLATQAVKEEILNRNFGVPTEKDLEVQLTEPELQTRLLSLLEKMGVSVVSIKDYTKNYKIKNGVDISANALADISNQVIALKDGIIDLSALTEETSHFIVEAWNQDDISNLLRSIDKTDEYIEFADFYRSLYSKQDLSGEEVENLVRKEVLGKVLAKALNNDFSIENKTDVQVSILGYIKNLLRDFLIKVNKLFSVKDEITLNDFTNQVKDLVLSQNINNYLNTKNYSDKKFVMYQITNDSGSDEVNKLLKQSRTALAVLQQQERDLLKSGKGLKSNVKRLGELSDLLNSPAVEEALITNSFVEILSSASRQAQYINQAADVAKKNGTFLTNEEGIVFRSLESIMKPVLSEMKDYLVKENKSENKSIINEIDNINTSITDIVGKMRTQDDLILNSIIDKMMVRHSLPESARDKLRLATKSAQQDTTAFYATFGQLSHAKDPLLNITGTILHDLGFDANVKFANTSKEFLSKIEELGFKAGDLQQFFDDGYLIDVRDWSAYNKKENEISAQALKNVTGTTLSVEDIIKYKKDPKSFSDIEESNLPVIKTPEQDFNYNKMYRAAMQPYIEGLFEEGYYKDEQTKYDRYSIADTTIRVRKDLSIDRGTLISRVKDINGKIRYTKQDEIDLNAINIKRKKYKSLYNEFGVNKAGLMIRDGVLENKFSEANPDIIEVNGKIIEIDRTVAGATDAIVAFDLHKLDLIYQAEKRENPISLSQEFLDELEFIEQTEGREEALEFFRLNSTTNFSEEYWNSMDVKKSLIERLEGIPGADLLIEKLKNHKEKRKQIIKQYQSQQDASNILVREMSSDVIDNVLVLTESIDELSIEASKLLREERSDDDIITSEFTPNETYYNEIKSLNFQDKLDFIIKNTSKSNERRIRDFSNALDDKLRGKTLTESKQRLYDKYYAGNKEEALVKYAETKLAMYYMRFAPSGYSQYQNRLENTQESVKDVVFDMNLDDSLQITNNFSYYKAEEQAYMNKNYKSDFEGGYAQPKISQFKNEKFDNLFQPNIVDGEVVSVSRNEKLYELYKETMNYHRSNLARMGELGTHNLWKAPQISKTSMEKIHNFIKKKDKVNTIKEGLRDLAFYRVDDQAYGAEINGEATIKAVGTKYIPKYYLKDLENQKDISTDIFYSMTAFGQQACLYESRKNYFSDLMALQYAMQKRSYPEGKSAESTSTVKMFNSYVDAYLFGVKETKQLRVTLPILGQVDLTKAIRVIHTWILNRNLGFNAIIPFTSWATAESSNIIEKYTKRYLNPYSTGLAKSEFFKLAKDAISETMEINKKAKLNVMMEHFGISEVAGSYENSIYSKTFRSMPKVGMFLNEAANFPIIPRTVLTVMYDYRVVGGDLLNFNQYEKIQRSAGESKDKIIADWKELEDKSFYNYMKVSETGVTYDYDKLKEDTNSELSEEDFKNFILQKEKAITTRIREVVKVVDGQIPAYERSTAQRHFFLSFFTTHRGWLAIAYADRFKNGHLNLMTGQEEEGSYRTLGNFFQRNITGMFNNGFRSFLRDAKEDWDGASDLERANMKKVLFELTFLQGMVAIGWVIAQMAADDKNKDLYSLQLTNYLYFRLMNESTSQQVGIGGQFYDLIKNPIVGADTVKSIFSISEYYNTDVIERGRFAGMYKFQKQLMATVPGYKSLLDLANPRDAYNSYKFFNPDVDKFNPALWALNSYEK